MPWGAIFRGFAALIPHLFPNLPEFTLGLAKKRQGIIHLPCEGNGFRFSIIPRCD